MAECKPRILIVDDERTNISVLAEVLKENYMLSIATNGQEAIDIVRNVEKPEMILLDIMMPEMDGFEVCKRLKSDPNSADIPVIFITAMSDSVNEEKGLKLGAVDFITKPFSPPIVLLRTKLHLEHHRYRVFLELLLKQRAEAMKETESILSL